MPSRSSPHMAKSRPGLAPGMAALADKITTQLDSPTRRSALDSSRSRRQKHQFVAAPVFGVCLPYGKDYPESRAWTDVDGRTYYSDNPPMLRLRRLWDRLLGRSL